MSGFSFQTLAEDLLSLEINTIVKADMTGIKMPANRREAFLKVYKTYEDKLIELQTREPVVWGFSGLMGFLELRERARLGMKATTYQMEHSKLEKLEKQDLKEKLIMLSRIKAQCEQLITVFIQLAEAFYEKQEIAKNGGKLPEKPKEEGSQVFTIPKGRFDLETYREMMAERVESNEATSEEFAPCDESSYPWNNDLPRNKMHMIPDLELNASQLSLLRKVSEIGTERIMLQTVIHADGDVTTRIAERLIYEPNETLFNIHNQAVDSSVRFWGNLVDTIGRMASGLLGKAAPGKAAK